MEEPKQWSKNITGESITFSRIEFLLLGRELFRLSLYLFPKLASEMLDGLAANSPSIH